MFFVKVKELDLYSVSDLCNQSLTGLVLQFYSYFLFVLFTYKDCTLSLNGWEK
jgi:hypothetical protein